MQTLPALALVCFFLSGSAAVADNAYPYTQSYVILINGETVGSETVIEKKGGSGEIISNSEHEILLSDGANLSRLAFTTQMVLPKGSLTPETYVYQYKTDGPKDSYELFIKDGQVKRVLNRNGIANEVSVPWRPNMVLIENTVYYQYEYLLRRYDMKKKGRQSFAGFIPVIGNDIPITVTLLNNGNVRTDKDKKDAETRNFRLDISGMQSLTISVDKNGRLVKAENPARHLSVIRKDMLP